MSPIPHRVLPGGTQFRTPKTQIAPGDLAIAGKPKRNDGNPDNRRPEHHPIGARLRIASSFALLFLSMLAYLAIRCSRAALARQSSVTAPLVATSATALVGLHALVDFSMQMQAVALTVTALLGGSVAQSWSGSVQTSQSARDID